MQKTLLKEKWNIKSFDRTLIARLVSELEGSCYILDTIDEDDYNTVKMILSKYYKIYFSLPKK